MDPVEAQRYAITASCLAGAYIAFTCPCRDPFLSCHYKEMVIATAFPLLLTLWLNRAVIKNDFSR